MQMGGFILLEGCDLQGSIQEVKEHVHGPGRLGSRGHVAGIPQHKHAQVLDILDVTSGLSIALVHLAVSDIVLINGGPGLHGGKHLQDATMVADDVKVAIIDQDLK